MLRYSFIKLIILSFVILYVLKIHPCLQRKLLNKEKKKTTINTLYEILFMLQLRT